VANGAVHSAPSVATNNNNNNNNSDNNENKQTTECNDNGAVCTADRPHTHLASDHTLVLSPLAVENVPLPEMRVWTPM